MASEAYIDDLRSVFANWAVEKMDRDEIISKKDLDPEQGWCKI
jgi:hypothetical protein